VCTVSNIVHTFVGRSLYVFVVKRRRSDDRTSPAVMLRFWATDCKTDRCLFCLSVTLVYCGQTVGWIKIPLGIDIGLGADHIVLDVDPGPPSRKRAQQLPQFSAHVDCSQTAGLIKMPLDTEVGFGPGDIVLD